MTAKPISKLAEDLRKFVEEGRAQAGPRIVFALQHEGPWWTGTFGRNWVLSATKITPTISREEYSGKAIDEAKTAKVPKEPVVLRVPRNSPLYIGNKVQYAGFAINAPGQLIRGLTYEQHAKASKQFTATSVDWYEQYTKGGKIMDDLTEGFRRAGAIRL
tara:strand:+ start:867 stop:1346 length:480 start_codon:yes stop_codon:yes gene_type:complete